MKGFKDNIYTSLTSNGLTLTSNEGCCNEGYDVYQVVPIRRMVVVRSQIIIGYRKATCGEMSWRVVRGFHPLRDVLVDKSDVFLLHNVSGLKCTATQGENSGCHGDEAGLRCHWFRMRGMHFAWHREDRAQRAPQGVPGLFGFFSSSLLSVHSQL